MDSTPLPSFGFLADNYLQAHGYTMRALLHVQHAVYTSDSHEQFSRALSLQGMPITEATFLWNLISMDADYNDGPLEIAAEKSAARKRRKEFRTEYSAALAAAQNNKPYNCMKINKHSATRWNAFVRQEVKHANDALPPGTERQKAPAMMKDLSECWKDMLKDEREAIMEDAVGDLNDHQEMKELSQRNIPVSSFQDGKRTLASIDRELAALNARTGIEIIVLAVRSDVDHFNQLHVFHTERARDFFTACLKSSVHDIAFRLEGFCVAGVKGLARTHIEEVIQLKKQISELVLQKLQTAAAPQKSFTVLGNPMPLNSARLTDTEFKLWEEDQFQAALALQNEATVEGTQNEATVEGTQPSESSPKHPLESSPVTTDTAHPNNTDPQTQPQPDANPCPSGSSQPRGCRCKAPSAEVLNTVFSSNSDGVPVQKKARKERSDKGKARGPRKKVPTDAPQESEVPTASAE
ncbi:hypothetical protein DFH29DRAFT_1003968 [Suillus ampliporus]|nr:hypothetical protein DFH29DRAFT_1003968 [Suillus ampliporus]